MAEAKEWLEDNGVKYERFEPAEKSLEGVLSKITTIEAAGGLSEESYLLAKASIEKLQIFIDSYEPPLKIGDIGPIDDGTHLDHIDDEPEIIHLLSDSLKELKALNSIVGG